MVGPHWKKAVRLVWCKQSVLQIHQYFNSHHALVFPAQWLSHARRRAALWVTWISAVSLPISPPTGVYTAQARSSEAALRPTSSLALQGGECTVVFRREKKSEETCLFLMNGFSQNLRCSLDVLRLKGQQSQVLSCSFGFHSSQCTYVNVPHPLS